MADQEFLERIDAHMARGNELFARLIDEQDQTRVFMRDLVTRQQRVTDQLVREIGAQRGEIRAQTDMLVQLRAESRAQQQGFMSLIDQLRSGGFGPS